MKKYGINFAIVKLWSYLVATEWSPLEQKDPNCITTLWLIPFHLHIEKSYLEEETEINHRSREEKNADSYDDGLVVF